MNGQACIDQFGFEPVEAELTTIRELLAAEAELECSGAGGMREDDLALACCVQLFANADPADSIRIHRAKRSRFDLACYLDFELTCGAGVDATKAWLVSHPSPAASALLAEIRQREPELAGFEPADYLTFWRGYFTGGRAT